MLCWYIRHTRSYQMWWDVPAIQTSGRLRHVDDQFQAILATQRNNHTQHAPAKACNILGQTPHLVPSSGTFSASAPSTAQCLRMRETLPVAQDQGDILTLKPSVSPTGNPVHAQPFFLTEGLPADSLEHA